MRRQSGLLATAGLAALLTLPIDGAALAQHGGGHMGGGMGRMGGGMGNMGGFGGFSGMSGINRGIPGGLGGGYGGMGGVHRGLPGGMGGSLMSGVNGGQWGGGMGGGQWVGGGMGNMGGGQWVGGVPGGGRLGGLNGLPGGVQFGYRGNQVPRWGGNAIGPVGGWRGGGQWGGQWGGPGMGWGVTRAGSMRAELGWPGYYGLGGLGWGVGGLGWGLGGIGWGVSSLGWMGYPGWGLGGLGWGYPGWGMGWGYDNLGWGLGGIGLSSWGYGPMLYDWGYSSYLNPYYMAPISVYDYSRPLIPTAVVNAVKAAGPAASLFESARTAFEGGLYTAALDYADQAVEKRPEDPTLHEFRALCLFALKRYDEAATALYPVLSIGPGWDWRTLIGLYGDHSKTYTAQIRALEDQVRANPDSAQAHFLLAYHYLTQGHGDAALGQVRAVTKLKPTDKLSARLLKELEKAKNEALAKNGEKPAEPAAAQPPAAAKPEVAVPEGNLKGIWTAKPSNDATITLDLTKEGKFAWTFDDKGQAKKFQGVRAIGNDILTLVRGDDASQPPMVGRVSWTDNDHFDFKLIGAGDDDPGLAFARKK